MRQRGRGALGVAGLVAAPVVLGIVYAAAGAVGVAGVGAAGFTTARLVRVMTETATWRALIWTLATAAGATLAATAAAIGVAVVFRQSRAADRAAQWIAVVPLPVPPVVAAAGGVLILGQSGLLARLGYALGLLSGPAAMPPLVFDRAGLGFMMTMAWKEFPFLALVAFSLLATRTPAFEEAARTLGAGPWPTVCRVTLPLLWRGLLPAVVTVVIFIGGSYEAAAVLAPSDPLPLSVYTLERYEDLDLTRRGDAYVLTLIGLGVGLVAVAAHEWARAGRPAALER